MTAIDLLEHTELDVPPVLAVQLDATSASDPASIGAAMQQAFGRLGPYIGQHDLAPIGPPRAIYRDFGAAGTRFTLAIPVAHAEGVAPAPQDGISVESLPGGRMHRFTHRGPYDGLAETYGAITTWMRQARLMKEASDWAKYAPMWEEYVGDPATTPSTKLLTYIYLPVK